MFHKYTTVSEKAYGHMFDFFEKHSHVLKHLLEEKRPREQARFYSCIRVAWAEEDVSSSIAPRAALAEHGCQRAKLRSGHANQPQRGHRHLPGVSICPWQQIEIWNTLLGRDFCLLLFSGIGGEFLFKEHGFCSNLTFLQSCTLLWSWKARV